VRWGLRKRAVRPVDRPGALQDNALSNTDQISRDSLHEAVPA
jgi:hypothetical protein